MRLLPTLYLNQNIAYSLVALLKKHRIKAVHTNDVNNQGATDEFQLEYAANKKYVLVTHNRRHFRSLHREWARKGKMHAGIIVIGMYDSKILVRRIIAFFEQEYQKIKPPFCEVPPLEY